MKKFTLRLLTYGLLLAGITLLANGLYVFMDKDNDPDYTEKFKTIPAGIQICNFGSSHGLFGFDYHDFKDRRTCFSFALESQSLSYDLRLLKHHIERLQGPGAAFIVISYFSLFGRGEIYGEGFASKNRRYYKILPRDLIKQYDWRTDLYVNFLPMLVGNLRRAFFGGGKKEIPTADAIDVAADARGAYQRHLGSKKFDAEGRRIQNQEEIDALFEMIRLCRQRGLTPILVTTPFLSEYTDIVRQNDPAFLGEFYALLDKICQEAGVEYCDYSMDERFVHDYSLFRNSDHLNPSGARKFTDILLQEKLGLTLGGPDIM